MAEVVDVEQEVGELEVVSEQIEEKAKETAAQEAAPKSEDDVPDEFKGKSIAELARMTQHARREMGKQANELGEVRRLADELLRSQLQKKPEPDPVKEVDFFENPQEAIRQAVENNPKVLAAEQYARQVQMEQAKHSLVQKHPDFVQVVQDGDFVDWVKGSKIRMQLFQAAEAYNVDAADELLSTFKTLKAAKTQKVSEEDTKARDQSLKAAAVDTGGSGESSRKVYRRADLIRLKLRDPAKFDAMQDEIDAAYRDGRVK